MKNPRDGRQTADDDKTYPETESAFNVSPSLPVIASNRTHRSPVINQSNQNQSVKRKSTSSLASFRAARARDSIGLFDRARARQKRKEYSITF